MATLSVGPGGQYSTISAAVAASHSGDIIQVQAGTYTNDFPPEIGHDLTLQAVGGRVNMVATVSLPNSKGILDIGGPGVSVTVTGFNFCGAQVSQANGENGAGIRYEGGDLTLVNDYFHNNQDGLLGNPDPAGTITITNCKFSSNGSGVGNTHNLYVGAIDTLTVTNSYFTCSVVGHEIKSRAANTFIENNRIQDGPTGTGSYNIDLPNGGNALVTGNLIEKGPNAENARMLSFGEEGGVYANSALTVTANTFLNDLSSPTSLAVWNATTASAIIANNAFYGLTAAEIAGGPAKIADSSFLATEPALNTMPPWTTATGRGHHPQIRRSCRHAGGESLPRRYDLGRRERDRQRQRHRPGRQRQRHDLRGERKRLGRRRHRTTYIHRRIGKRGRHPATRHHECADAERGSVGEHGRGDDRYRRQQSGPLQF